MKSLRTGRGFRNKENGANCIKIRDWETRDRNKNTAIQHRYDTLGPNHQYPQR